METTQNQNARFPAVALRGMVAFPGITFTVDAVRAKTVAALEYAMTSTRKIFLVAQKDATLEQPQQQDLYKMGCVCRIHQLIKLPDGTAKALVEGIYRAEMYEFADGDFFAVAIKRRKEIPITINNEEEASFFENALDKLRKKFSEYAKYVRAIPKDVVDGIIKTDKVSEIADMVAFAMPIDHNIKQHILEDLDALNRILEAVKMLNLGIEAEKINDSVEKKTRVHIDDEQRKYFLREQAKIINDELYGTDEEDEVSEYYAKIDQLDAPDSVKERIAKEVIKLSKMPSGAHDAVVSRGWIDVCCDLPWDKVDEVKVDVIKAQKILDRDFYGMKKVKDRILEMLSVYALNPDIKGQIICLAGPPGVGKTSIGKTIAECMGRKYVRVSLGGVHDEAEIRGHRKTYLGSMPGRIIDAIKKAGTSNPLILLDEIDKLGSDHKGDPASAMLEVLDPEQNVAFRDNFLEIPYDLSKAVFITTANRLDTIPAPLLDRMEVIELDSYTRDEKLNIAKKHLVAKQLERHALKPSTCRISEGALLGLIDFYTREAGVRKLERSIASLCSKAAKQIASGEKDKVSIGKADLEKLLGKHKYRPEVILEDDCVGIINGLAWTSVGGEIMQLEVAVLNGTGKTVLTGSLGDVMKESASAAVTFVRANAEKYGIDSAFYKDRDIHIHATEAAVPKDGPSAGVTITTALVSALTSRKIRRDIAMTGEVTVTGRVLPIGGLKEKAMAAHRGGVKTVFIPKSNLPDIDEIDKTVRDELEFIPVSFVGDIIDAALIPEPKKSVGTRGRVVRPANERISQQAVKR